MPRRAILGLLLVGVLAWPSHGDGCCMVPARYEGDVDQSMQQVVVLFDEGTQDMVLRVRPFFREASEPPASLAWLITVPTPPTSYAVADAAIFDDARALANRLIELADDQRPKPYKFPSIIPMMSAGVDGMLSVDEQMLDVGEKVEVGPYAITPVTARGGAAVEALNAYLAEHGFGTEDPEHMRWFAENEFTFLCIRITPPEGRTLLGEHLELDPLHLRFASERPYYPGKYSANQGDFALALTLLTRKPIARYSLSAVKDRLRAWDVATDNLFTTRALPGALAAHDAHGGAGRWFVNHHASMGFNRLDENGRPRILGWKDDVTWTLGGEADLPPDWYYGDGEAPAWHVTKTRAIVQFLIYLVAIGIPVVLLLWGGVALARAVRRAPDPGAGDGHA